MTQSQALAPQSYRSMSDVSKKLHPWHNLWAVSWKRSLSIATVHDLCNLQEEPYTAFCFLSFLNLLGFLNLKKEPAKQQPT